MSTATAGGSRDRPGPGGEPHVRVLDAATGASLAGFFAYDPAFTGGVHVAAVDLNRLVPAVLPQVWFPG